MRDLGTTILLTTHYMEEAQHLADRVAVLRAGRLVAIGRPDELGDGARPVSTLRFRLPAGISAADLPTLDGEVAATDGVVEATTAWATKDVHTLTGWALERDVGLAGLTVGHPTPEDVYLRLIEEAGDGN